MAGELNTDVLDDPESCRTMADWLGRSAQGVEQGGDIVYRKRSDSESFWKGSAGDACRGTLTQLGQHGDEIERSLNAVRLALSVFADAIDAAKKTMTAARQDASAARLIVTPNSILPPGPAPADGPQPLPAGPRDPKMQAEHDAASQAHGAAMAAFTEKKEAFDRAQAAVSRARASQADAHQSLDKAMVDPLASIKSTKSIGMLVGGTALSSVKSTQTAANDLFENADKVATNANRMQAIAEDPALTAAGRAAATRAANVFEYGAKQEHANYEQVQKPIGRVPESIRQGIELSPGGLIKSGTGWAKLGKGVLRGLPVAGTGLSIGSGVADHYLSGKSWGTVGVETGANIGGGVVGGMAGAEVGGAVGTMIFPGPGTVIGGVVGGVAGGVIGSVSGTEGADQAMGVK